MTGELQILNEEQNKIEIIIFSGNTQMLISSVSFCKVHKLLM